MTNQKPKLLQISASVLHMHVQSIVWGGLQFAFWAGRLFCLYFFIMYEMQEFSGVCTIWAESREDEGLYKVFRIEFTHFGLDIYVTILCIKCMYQVCSVLHPWQNSSLLVTKIADIKILFFSTCADLNCNSWKQIGWRYCPSSLGGISAVSDEIFMFSFLLLGPILEVFVKHMCSRFVQ